MNGLDRSCREPGRLMEWIATYKRQTDEVHYLMQLAPNCPEFPDLLSTLRQAIATAEAELEGPQETCASNPEGGFTVACDPIPLDLLSFSPSTVAKHVTAIQQRAAMLGSGPPDWAVGAKCQARAGPEQEWRKAVIEGITPAGNYLVDWLPSARESCFEVDASDLQLVPPIAGAFWTPKQPPPWDPTLSAHTVIYSQEEKATQREAYDQHLQGVKDAIATGKRDYTFPPGIYRSREKIYMEGPQDFTLIMANVEWVREEDDFIGLRCCRDITIRGPLVLDADPLPFSQCAVTGSDGATYLDLEVMPGYQDPSTDGKIVFYDSTGKIFPTGQVWCHACNSTGDGRFRMEFDWGNQHTLRIPGLAKAGNYITMGGKGAGIQLSCDTNVTLEHIRSYCGGDVWGFEYGDCKFTDLRALRRPGTSRLFSGGRFYQVWFEGGSFEMDRCEVAYNDDDLSDVFTWMGYTCANADSDSSMFAVGASGIRWQPGNTLCLYDCRSLEQVATACIKAIDPCTDQSALEELNAAFKAAGMGEGRADDFKLVQLDRPLNVPCLCIVDNMDTHPKRISFTNCYFHDGLNCGIVSKGALDSLVANNVVERTRVSGIETSCGGEGAIAGNVMIRNNTVCDAYYLWTDEGDFLQGPAITVSVGALDEKPTGLPIKSSRIVGNLVVNPRGKPINVSQCADVAICGNLPADPLPSDAPDYVTTA